MRRFVFEKRLGALVGCALLAGACAPDLDTTRAATPGGNVGQEVYGVVCDRVGAQALPEDLTGASFNGICHPDASGAWQSKVDVTILPPITASLTDSNGNPISVSAATSARAHGVARIEALARDRTSLIAALNATFPNDSIPVKDTTNPNPAETCKLASKKDTLPRQLADLLGRFTALYDDGTIPQSTESFARVLAAFGAQTDVQAAYARLHARQGYRPLDVALGAARPVLAYPNLRDFANATLDLVSSTGSGGSRAGAAYPQLQTLLAAAYQELRTETVGTPPSLLTISGIDPVGRQVLSRPRADLEVMQQIFFAEDAAFGGGASEYITTRDPRGYAAVRLAGKAVPPPFVDADGDGLADVNALGAFVTAGGVAAPTPFLTVGGPAAPASDSFGRALNSAGGQLYYDYLDTSHVYAASLLDDMQSFVDPVPSDDHETLMNALAGAYVLMGARLTTSKQYGPDPSAPATWSLTHGGSPPAGLATQPVNLSYSGFMGGSSPMLDLVYGLASVAADRTNDDALAYTQALLAGDVANVARLTGVGLAMQSNATSHSEAHIPPTSTFWDEMIDVTIQIEQVPGLLEDILTALGDDRSLMIPGAFGAYNKYNDAITYDTNNLNGPPYNVTTKSASPPATPVDRSKPDTGANRSEFQRFTQLIHDTDGLTVCNKANANVLAQIDIPVLGQTEVTLPLGGGTYDECAVFKIENAAAFYLDSIIGKANLYLRDDTLREGFDVLGFHVEPATVGLMQESSGLTGFWDGTSSTTLRPTPQFLDRQLFFDQANDSPKSGPNHLTNQFLAALLGPSTGTTVCPARVLVDPCASSSSNCADAPDIAPDGLVAGLTSCGPGDSLLERDANTIFVWEDESFYTAMTPVVTAFANHASEQLFINLMETLDRHWADDKGTADECLLSVDPKATYKTCSKDGLVTYEPLLVQQYTSDLIPALHDLVAVLQTLKVPHCDSMDPVTHACTPSMVDGVSVMANTIRSLVDPTLAQAASLTDRQGHVTGQRNDGTTNPQVTRLYLILEALNGIDAAFASYASKNPMDTGRQAAWRSARSQIVDQLFTIDGSKTGSRFADGSVPAVLPVVLGALRAQVAAHCPASFNAPYPPCDWAAVTLTADMQETIEGPLFAATMDLTDALRQSTTSRTELEALLTYLLDAASGNQARATMFGAAEDMFQVLADDTNLVPFYHVLAEAARPSVVDAGGTVVQKSLADAQIGLLSRIAARGVYEEAGGKQVEDCKSELDPNQVISIALTHLVTPMASSGGAAGTQTPLDVILDVVDDVNRASPDASSALDGGDYASIAANVTSFLSDKQRGLEQFYEVVRLGTE